MQTPPQGNFPPLPQNAENQFYQSAAQKAVTSASAISSQRYPPGLQTSVRQHAFPTSNAAFNQYQQFAPPPPDPRYNNFSTSSINSAFHQPSASSKTSQANGSNSPSGFQPNQSYDKSMTPPPPTALNTSVQGRCFVYALQFFIFQCNIFSFEEDTVVLNCIFFLCL